MIELLAGLGINWKSSICCSSTSRAFPDTGFGWQNEFYIYQIPSKDFAWKNQEIDLSFIVNICFEFGNTPTGAIGIDDIGLSKSWDFGSSAQNIDAQTQRHTFSYYPNPATDFVMINAEFEEYEILDLKGRVIVTGGSTNQINLSSISTGVYLLRIVDGFINHLVNFL